MLERVLQAAPATISASWYEDGTLVDPGTVTVGITRADGTVLVAAGTATTGTGAAARTYLLSAADTALLDRLKVTWVSPTKGTLTTYVEVAGGFLFSEPELAAELTGSSATYTSAQRKAARLWAETKLERACGLAFVPRYARETHSGDGGWDLRVRWPFVRAIRSVALDGVAVTDLTGYHGQPYGFIHSPTRWTRTGHPNVVVGYEHGLDYPPEDVVEAALIAAKHRIMQGPVDDRTTSMSTADGTFTLATPGLRGSSFGIPDVDEVVQAYRVPLVA